MIHFSAHIEEETLPEIGRYLVLEASCDASETVQPTSLHMVQVLDVSGSMDAYMDHVRSTSLATVDIVAETEGTLRVVTFDSQIQQVLPTKKVQNHEKDALYTLLRNGIINRGETTNIELVLQNILKERSKEPTHIMFLTDGVANTGTRTSSDALLKFARQLPGYSNVTIHTMGLALNGNTSLNASLLKELALDTNGAFRIVNTIDELPTFLGDIQADYENTILSQINVQLYATKGSSIGPIQTLLSRVPIQGPSVRLDRPLRLVWALHENTCEEISMSIFGRQTHGHFEHHVRESLMKQPLHPETLSIVAGTTSDISKLKTFIEFCSRKAMESTTDASSWSHVKTLIESRLSELEVPSVADRLDVSQNAYELTSPFATRLTPSVNTLRQRSQATARAHMITNQTQGSDPKAPSTLHRTLFDDDDA